MGTVCKELCDYGVLDVNKTDGWAVQQQQRRLSRAFLATGEQRSCFGPCDMLIQMEVVGLVLSA